MCGIVGIINAQGTPVSTELLRQMTDLIAHRGPDGEGHWVCGPVGLGHRRLSIIDLSPRGSQPMATPDGQFVITYNGEAYNFRELRSELEALGHAFRSTTDSEVVLHAYAEWGAACVERLNGMFAFAIWDVRRRELFLARDRYGIKPLYYARTPGALVFGSEHKALLAHPEVSRRIDLEALLEYFTFQNIFTDRTLFQDIRLFPAGCWARVPEAGGEVRPVRYWDFDFRQPQKRLSTGEYAEELDRLFRQAVHRQMVSDVPLGCYLSGGMDSGSITAVAAAREPYLRTFTCGFDLRTASGLELGFDEREKSEFMSYLFKTEHYEVVLKAGDMERVLPELVWHLEEPRVGQCYPNYYVSRLASKFVKVVLSGAGGDELFGGYPWRYYRAMGSNSFEHYVDKYYRFWQRLIDNQDIRRVFRPVWGEVKHVWTRDIFRDVFQKHQEDLTEPEDYINHSLYLEAKTFLHGLLVVEDKLSMAHSLETRVPFLDNDLVDFAMGVPVRLKVRDLVRVARMNENEVARYFTRSRSGKVLLRDVMKKYVPDAIHKGRKQGFSAPDATWFKGESIDYIKRQLFADDSRIFAYLDRDAVGDLVQEHLDGEVNRRLFIWSLLYVDRWLRVFAG
jgi:asparagine synthase (glutamine-hydrolysing)